MKNKLKIIAGKYKGKQLNITKTLDIRPTQNYIKEAIFNTIQFKIKDTAFLDMYAGLGSIGIEALSRGALYVDFIDDSYEAISIIKKNLYFAKKNDDFRIINYKITSKSICITQLRKYDFIFMDPPYKRGYIDKGLSFVKRCNLLSTNGVLIIESLEHEKYDINGYVCFKNIKYNKKIVRFLKRSNI